MFVGTVASPSDHQRVIWQNPAWPNPHHSGSTVFRHGESHESRSTPQTTVRRWPHDGSKKSMNRDRMQKLVMPSSLFVPIGKATTTYASLCSNAVHEFAHGVSGFIFYFIFICLGACVSH